MPIPNQRWKIRIPSVNAGTMSARTVVLRRRQYNARSTLALLITPFAGRSPFTAFILGCELSLQPCLVVQRMIVPFEQNVLLEVLRREPALMCPCCSTLSTHTTHHSLSRSCLIPLHGMGDSLPKHANRRASTDTDRRRRAHAHKHRHRCTRVHRETDRETEHKRTAHTGQLRNAHHSPAWGSAAYQPERPMRNETRYSSVLPLAVSTAKPSPCSQCRSFAPCHRPAQCGPLAQCDLSGGPQLA